MPNKSKCLLRDRTPPRVVERPPAAARRRAPWAWGTFVVLAFAVFLLYGPALDAPFIFDDTNSVETNETIVRLWPLVGDDTAPGPLNTPELAPTSSRPVVNLSLAVSYQFGGLNPTSFRLFNVVLHLLTASLLAALVRRTLRLPRFAGRFDTSADWLALFVAMLWALHPLQTEAVAYVTQRTELMMAFFYLATLYCSLRYWMAFPLPSKPSHTHRSLPLGEPHAPLPLPPGERNASLPLGERNASLPLPLGEGRGEGNRRTVDALQSLNNDRTGWLLLATLACLAGMGSKEVMVSAPLMVLFFERTFVAGSLGRALRGSWPLYAGLLCGWLLLAWLNVGRPHGDAAGFHLGVPAHVWWFTQSKVLLMYAKLVVWPWPLLIHYELPYIETLGQAWPYLLLVAIVGLATLWLLWQNTPTGFLATLVFAVLSPTFVIPIVTEVAAERRMYLPLTAILTLVVVGMYRLFRSVSSVLECDTPRPIRFAPSTTNLAVASCVVATVFGLVSHRRLSAYDKELTLWQEVLQQQPDNFMAHGNVGRQYELTGNAAKAMEHYRQATKLKPNSSVNHYNLARLLSAQGQAEEAIEHFRLAAKHLPNSPNLLNNLGVSLYVAGRYEEAIQVLQNAVQLKPNMWRAYDNLGTVLARLGRWAEAIDLHERAIELNPTALDVYGHLAAAQAQADQPTEAVATAERALQLARSSGEQAAAARIEADLTAYRARLENDDKTTAAPDAAASQP